MKLKTILVIIFIVVVGAETCSLLYENNVIDISLGIATLIGFVYLFINSSVTTTRYFIGIVAGMAVISLGVVFKIMHLPGASLLLAAGFMLIPLFYTLRYFNKSSRGIADLLKWLWVMEASVSAALMVLHILPDFYRDLAMFPGRILLWGCILSFLYSQYGREENIPDESPGDIIIDREIRS